MKKTFIGVRIGLGICAALGWWGLIYPELAMTPDTYRVVSEVGSVQQGEDVVEWDFDSNIYKKVLSADKDQIRFRSKLLQTAADCLGKLQ